SSSVTQVRSLPTALPSLPRPLMQPPPPLLAPLRVFALVLLLTVSCSVFDPKFEAVTPGPSGAQPAVVEVDYRGNEGIASRRLHQRINEYMLDLSREPSNEAA